MSPESRGRRRVVVALVTWLCYVLQAPVALHLGMLLVDPGSTSGAQYPAGLFLAVVWALWIGLVPALLAVWLSAKSPRFGTAVIVVMPCYLLGVVLLGVVRALWLVRTLWLRESAVVEVLYLPLMLPALIPHTPIAIVAAPLWLVTDPMQAIPHFALVAPVILVLLVVYRLTSRAVSDTW